MNSEIPLLKPVYQMLDNYLEFSAHAQIKIVILYRKPGRSIYVF